VREGEIKNYSALFEAFLQEGAIRFLSLIVAERVE